MEFLILLFELAALYFLSRLVIKSLFALFILLSRSRSVAVTLLLLLTFPGTVVHELSHLFSASVLGVPVGKLTFEPEDVRKETIKTGSVAIAETDPVRRFLIGVSPVAGGLVILCAISYFLPKTALTPADWRVWALGYLLLSVSDTMFSSPQDMKGSLPLIITSALFLGLLYYLGLRFTLTGPALDLVLRVVTTLVQSVGIVLIINIGILLCARLVTAVFIRIFRKKISQ